MTLPGDIVSGLWSWPDGLAWRAALAASRRQRRRRFKRFMRQFHPHAATRVLDVGVEGVGASSSNSFESLYPWPRQLTAAGMEGRPEICRQRGIEFVQADGCDLPFTDGAFDIVHCNAVLEHVGARTRQRRFVTELCRVGRSVWLATPNAEAPVEVHTLLPAVHWLGPRCRSAAYRFFGRSWFAEETNLNLLDATALHRLFPASLRRDVQVHREWLAGLPLTLVATLSRA
jgi:SAM-dependent methyltransferase